MPIQSHTEIQSKFSESNRPSRHVHSSTGNVLTSELQSSFQCYSVSECGQASVLTHTSAHNNIQHLRSIFNYSNTSVYPVRLP